MNFLDFFSKSKPIKRAIPKEVIVVPPGRVSQPDNNSGNGLYLLKDQARLVTPSYRTDIIPLIRNLYKINPDVSIAVQDMYKLVNTGHTTSFPYNTSKEVEEMQGHLRVASKKWNQYTSGIDGVVNKMIVQCLVGGAISIEAVPKVNLSGLETIIFIKPEDILFARAQNGLYQPYQKVKNNLKLTDPIKLNQATFFYVAMFNDTDEPYGIPPLMSSLDPLEGQHTMRANFKHIMEQQGMLGFLTAEIEKSSRRGGESDNIYSARLQRELTQFKQNLLKGMADGVIVGNKDDHKFDFKSTTKDLSNVDKLWEQNQQSVANGLSVNGSIIGVKTTNTEGGAGIMLSKMISQLKNFQMILSYTLEKIYQLELQLAGFNCKGVKVTFGSSTISDELKVQQGLEIKIRNQTALYNQGIISQEDYAWAVGADAPDQPEPRVITEIDDSDDAKEKRDRKDDKTDSDRKVRSRTNPNPKRGDQDTRKR